MRDWTEAAQDTEYWTDIFECRIKFRVSYKLLGAYKPMTFNVVSLGSIYEH